MIRDCYKLLMRMLLRFLIFVFEQNDSVSHLCEVFLIKNFSYLI